MQKKTALSPAALKRLGEIQKSGALPKSPREASGRQPGSPRAGSPREKEPMIELVRHREEQMNQKLALLIQQNQLLKSQLNESAVPDLANGLQEVRIQLNQMGSNVDTALRSLEDKIDFQLKEIQSRLSGIDHTIAEHERMRMVLRDEQTAQHFTLCQELDQLREEVVAVNKRLDARDASLANLGAAQQSVNNNFSQLEERVAALDKLPLKVGKDMMQIEERYNAFVQSVTAERLAVANTRSQAQIQQEDQFREILFDARQQLQSLEVTTSETIDSLMKMKTVLRDELHANLDEKTQSLEKQLHTRLAEQDEMVKLASRHFEEHTFALKKMTQDATTELRTQSEFFFQGMRSQYVSEVEATIQDIHEKAREMEEQRRKEFPAVDADRVKVLVEELKGASVVVENIARKCLTSNEERLVPILHRIEQVEQSVTDLVSKPAVIPPFQFSVPSQTDASYLNRVTAEDEVAKLVKRNLDDELQQAAQEVSDQAFWNNLVHATSANNQRAPQSSRSISIASDAKAIAPGVNGYGSSTAATLQQPVSEVRAAKRAALEKVNEALRQIQQHFHTLSEKERDNRASERSLNAKSSQQTARQLAEEISKKKEEVFQAERQLVEQRNRLWKELSELPEE